jgi:trk system potassium uptake protein
MDGRHFNSFFILMNQAGSYPLLIDRRAQMFVIIAGNGRLAVGLACSMSSRKDDVVIVDKGIDTVSLGPGFDGVVVDGDPMDMDTMEKAGMDRCELFIAATGDDKVNIACAQAAASLFKVPKTLARIADPDLEALYRGIGLATVCPTATGINQVLDMIAQDNFSPLEASLDPTMLCVHPIKEWIGQSFSSIVGDGGTRVVGIVRNGRLARALGGDRVREKDTVVLTRTEARRGSLWSA